jgi:glutathione S-transferase
MFTLYGFGPTRSARPKWILQELGAKFQEVDGRKLIGTEEYAKIHPQAKLPALDHNGKIVFESVAIVNYLADMHPEANLIPRAGTYERALHDQWSCFALAELEAWLWSNAKQQMFYPEEKRAAAVVATNTEEFRKSAKVVDSVLAKQDYILGNEFSAADINLSYSLNWGRCFGALEDQANIRRYLDRLHDRPASPLREQTEFFKKNR